MMVVIMMLCMHSRCGHCRLDMMWVVGVMGGHGWGPTRPTHGSGVVLNQVMIGARIGHCGHCFRQRLRLRLRRLGGLLLKRGLGLGARY